MGDVTLTAPDSLGFLAGSTLSGGIINGYDTGSQSIKTSGTMGGTFKTPCKSLTVGLAYDYVNLATTTTNAANALVNSAGYESAVAGYLLWQATEKLSFNTRADYFQHRASISCSLGHAEQGVRSHRNGPV